MVIVPNVAPDPPPLKKNPVFLYVEDRFQKPYPFQPDIAVDISYVVDQKVYAVAAHKSQFFEWLPCVDGALESVPQTEEEKLKWLKSIRIHEVSPSVKETLVKWYGNEKGNKAEVAEAFEICEYGKQPNKEEIYRLFPMLKK